MAVEIHEQHPRTTAERLVTVLDQDAPGALAIAASSLRTADLSAAIEALWEEPRRRVFEARPPDLRDQVLADSDDARLNDVTGLLSYPGTIGVLLRWWPVAR